MLPGALLVLGFLCGAIGVTPDPPRPGIIGAKGLATATDCSGPVGFSAIGTARVHQTGLVSYRDVHVDRGIGFSRETGEFTVHCPGIYHIAFAGYSNGPNTRLILKKRTSNNTWTEMLAAGGAGGGSNQILLDLGVGDQTGVWLASGNISTEEDRAIPSTSFTAFRISKK